MRVRFFPTCLGDRFFADAASDAVALLRAQGFEVDVPHAATCCGQPAWNAGYVAEARRVARHTASAFPGRDPVILPSGSCAAMMRRHLPELLGVAADLLPPVFELAEFLAGAPGVRVAGRGLQGLRVAWHHGCHALRELGIRDAPVDLLRRVGADVVTWDAAEECCGFGGLFAVKLPHVSAAMADRKLDTLGLAGPVDVLASADPGCLLQLRGRLHHRGRSGPRVAHLATLLLEGQKTANTSPSGPVRDPEGPEPGDATR